MKTIDEAKYIKCYSPKGILTHEYKKSSVGDWIDKDNIVVDIVETVKHFEKFSSQGLKIVLTS